MISLGIRRKSRDNFSAISFNVSEFLFYSILYADVGCSQRGGSISWQFARGDRALRGISHCRDTGRCSGVGKRATAVKSASVPTPAVEADPVAASLHVFVETSGSCVPPALAEAWDTIRQELPELVEPDGITQFHVWHFDEDGWSPRRLREIQLSAKPVVTRLQTPGTEWASFANIRAAVRESEERGWRAEALDAQQRYRESISSALGALDKEPVLPDAKHETPRSDIVGLLRRVSQASERSPQYVLILTDLADTQYRSFPKLPPSEGKVKVLVLLARALPKDAALTLGKVLAGPEQFDIRARQLRRTARSRSVKTRLTGQL
jgi:hypothetical protein